MEQYVKQANKGHCQVVFEPGDWVWVHMHKEIKSLRINRHVIPTFFSLRINKIKSLNFSLVLERTP